MRKVQVLVGVFLLLAVHGFSYAQAPVSAGVIGSITFLEGVSDIARDNRNAEFVKEKEPVYINDIIRTKSYSKAEITFLDKSVLRLAPDTSISLEEYRIGGDNRREFSRIKLSRGRIEAVVSKTGTPDTFLIETPNARGTVKGSDIFCSYLGGKTGVFVAEGAISVFNSAVPGEKVKVTKDNCVVVPFDKAPGEIRAVRVAEMAYFKSSVGPAFIKKWIPSKDSTQMNGVIVALTGAVRLYKKGANDWREPKSNDIIAEGDKIQTEENSTAEIRMSNGNTIVIQPYTELSFTTLRYDPASSNYENTLAVSRGRLSAVVIRTKDQMAFQVQTPTAICGVRGTFMEVVVNPSAAGAVPQGGPVQPATQVFFEGGNGYVTSNITGTTREIGAGQNALVDAMGNVSAPLDTAPEQRSAMFQVWTSAHTMNNYSTAEGATGVGSNNQQQSLPVVGPQSGVDAAPMNEDIKNYLDEISNLDLEELTNEPVIQTIYDKSLPFIEGPEYEYGYGITGGTASVSLFDNNSWSMITSGTWIGDLTEVNAVFGSGSDSVVFEGSGENGVWSGDVTGHIESANAYFSGVMNGTYEGVEGGSGTFTGSGSGTYSDTPPGGYDVSP